MYPEKSIFCESYPAQKHSFLSQYVVLEGHLKVHLTDNQISLAETSDAEQRILSITCLHIRIWMQALLGFFQRFSCYRVKATTNHSENE